MLSGGVDTLALCAFANREGTETEEGHLVFRLDSVCDRVEGSVHSSLGLILRQVGLFSHCINEFCLIHNMLFLNYCSDVSFLVSANIL